MNDDIPLTQEPKFSFEGFIDKNKISLASFLIGLILIGFGVFMYKQGLFGSTDKIQILDSKAESANLVASKEIVVEISGAVEKPGIYKLKEGDRVEDLLIIAGGISASADRTWVEKFINRAAKLADGQKIYIVKTGELNPTAGNQSSGESANNSSVIKLDQGVLGVNASTMVNINTASLSELDTLPGIGQVYGQSIIDHRPYSSVSELLNKGALKQNVYEKVKDKISVY